MTENIKVAVLITCHNRKENTLKCLDSLFSQNLPGNISFDTYLVDDGSSDGTEEAVKQKYSDVNIIKGSGNLYWCGGMRLAWSEAMKKDYDYYLWLNDDTILFPKALETLIENEVKVKNQDGEGIIVGSTCDPDTKKLTYGGFSKPNGGALILPNNSLQQCATINGNIVLVSRNIAKRVGNLSPEFLHTSADMDYGLRARALGFKLWIAPKYYGYCFKHTNIPRWCDPQFSLRQRLKYLKDPKGQPPYEIYIYAKRHTKFWPVSLIKLYFKTFFPQIWFRFRRTNMV